MKFDTIIPQQMRQTAIIDVGSNSFRLIVVEFVPELWFKLVDEVRESVRLAEGMGEALMLQPAAIERAIDTLKMYAAFCHSAGIRDIRVCATAAVRMAQNQAEFIERVQTETGLVVQVLSDYEEASYGYLAVINSTTLENGYIMDLGGASLEITRVENRRMQESRSLKMGAVNMTEAYLGQPPTSQESVKLLYKAVRKEIKDLDWFKAAPNLRLIGQGGTVRNLARIAQKRQRYPLGELHAYNLQNTAIQRAIHKMTDKDLDGIKAISGMKEDRADIMLAGATIIRAVLETSGFKSVEICGQGLREGAFYNRYLYHKSNRRFDDVRRSTIYNLANLYPYQHSHAEHVAFLALRIFDQVPRPPMICDDDDRDLLWAAGILHDIGVSIDYNDHHKHSHYLILHQGLPGYDHRELILVSNLALYHRKGIPRPNEYPTILSETDQIKLIQMTACLRLAEQLDRSRDGAVRDVKIKTEAETCIVELEVEGDGVIAVWSVLRHADIFESAFGKALEISIREPMA